MSGESGQSELKEWIETWRNIIVGGSKSWVLFEHGTCVILVEGEGDLAARAVAVLREWGPVHVATPSADFSVIPLARHPGWVVTCHHPDVLVYVGPGDAGQRPADVAVGMLGRSRRKADAASLRVVHVEDRRGVI